MKKYLLFIFCVLNFASYAQQWDWVTQTNSFIGNNITTDGNGNIYFFGDTGSIGIYKYSNSGQFIWFKTIPDISKFDVDPAGNIYYIKQYTAEIYKLNTNGNPLWNLPGDTSVGGYPDIQTSGNNFVYAAYLKSVWDSSGNKNFGCLHKYSNSGILLWKKEFIKTEFKNIFSVKNDTTYLLGENADSAQIDSFQLSSNCYMGCTFYAAFEPNGKAIFARPTSGGYKTDISAAAILDGNEYIQGVCHLYSSSQLIMTNSNGQVLWNKNHPAISSFYGQEGISSIKNKSTNSFLSYFSSCDFGGGNCESEIDEFDLQGNIAKYCLLKNIGAMKLHIDQYGTYITGSIIDTTALGNFQLLPQNGNYFIAKFNGELLSNVNDLPPSANNLSIYPNPTSGKFTTQSTEKISSIVITNLLGEKVTQSVIPSGTRNFTIDLSEAPKGIYFVQVLSEGQSTVRKIVLN